jgi:hypothetical protein
MESKLDALRNVIQMQKGRLNGNNADVVDGVIGKPLRISRHENKITRSSRS